MHFFQTRILLGVLLLAGGLLGSRSAQALPRNYWNTNYDSLRRTLPQQPTDTARLRTLVQLLDITELSDAQRREQALPLLDELLALNQQLPLLDARPHRHLRTGLGLWMQGGADEQALKELHRAIVLFDQAHHPVPKLLIDLAPLYNRMHQSAARLTYFRRQLAYYRLHDYRENAAACYLVLGGSYRHLGDFNQAISCFLHAADLFQHFDRRLYANELMVAGNTYAEWGNHTKAVYYLQKAGRLLRHYQFKGLQEVYILNALSRLYRQLEQPAQALRYAELAVQAARHDSTNRPTYTAYALLLKGAALLQQGQPAQAYPLLRRSQQLADSLHMDISGRPGEFMLDEAWARYYVVRQQYGQAEVHWRTALQKATVSQLNMLRPRLLQELIRFYDAHQQPEQAQQYTRVYLALTDSLVRTQGRFSVAQYEGERLEQAQNTQIANLRQAQLVQTLRLRQRNLLLGVAVGALLLLVGLGAVLYRQLRRNRRTLAQLRATQQQLVAAEKWAFVGEVSAGIAHELQNPLHFMKRFADVSTTMLEQMKQQNQYSHAPAGLEHDIMAGLKQNLQEISQHGTRASSIIRDMLAHSRAGTGPRHPTDLNTLVAEQAYLAYQGLQAQDSAAQVSLTLDLAPELPLLELAPQDMGRALLNLLTNAFYAVQQRAQTAELGYQPQVLVRTQQLGRTVEISIRDNGLGINEEVQQQVFQPFFTTKPAGEGTGLGLSLSHDIIEKGHGGLLQVKSQPGEFTEFVVMLKA
ncbi:ATP-binding protein [Hymenobacter norwichensis]|uniref:ATP-binding protein n=1 Tax=Hymenobacter norwichensis TaxID=223903 RepID=UPI0003B5B39B|nr:ATP-binding protein [Hymenobacter norwichensis]